jgi:hypothetical protein
MVDIVYILTNEAMPGLIKIGCTNVELASRIKQLYTTGVPLPFELFMRARSRMGYLLKANFMMPLAITVSARAGSSFD